jgi:hypothetical protein
LRGSKGVGVTIESNGKIEISYINEKKERKEDNNNNNNNNKKRSKNNKSPNVVWET